MNWEPVQALFARAAAAAPSATALDDGERRVSYRDLDAGSAGLAARLAAAGAGKGAVVAIVSRDPVEVIRAVLASLRAGCVFVPLDPDAPEKRLAVLAGCVGPRWVPGRPRLGRDPRRPGRPRLGRPGASRWPPPRGRAAPLPPPRRPRAGTDPCYVYFTSGSTGTPKGITGRLRGIDHFDPVGDRGTGAWPRHPRQPPALARVRRVPPEPCSRRCPPAGTVCIPRPRSLGLLDFGPRLAWWLAERRVTPESTASRPCSGNCSRRPRPAGCRTSRHVLLSGERLLPADARRWTERHGTGTRLVNLYGATEATMAQVAHFVRPEDADRPSVPVGRPIDEVRVYVLTGRGRPCPTGVVGEIHISSPYRSLGYHNQPGPDPGGVRPRPVSRPTRTPACTGPGVRAG